MNRAVFLDRDGTIIKDVSYLSDPGEIILEDGAAEGIKIMNGLGLKVIIVTNQPHVARGIMAEDDVMEINAKIINMLEEKGARIDGVYFCPHHPEKHHQDIPPHALKYRIDCECRKPGTGMITKAAAEHGIDVKGSFMIGDRTMDIMTGKNAGCGTILVRTGIGGKDGKYDAHADNECENLVEAAEIISSQSVKILVLAGGKGERLMPLTKDIPKPMVEIGGKPAMQHHIELARKYGFRDVVICASHMADKIRTYFDNGKKFGLNIAYPEEPRPLGSGGAIKNAESFLDTDHFVVLNADVMTDINLQELVRFHLRNGGIATMVVRVSDHPKDSDVVLLEGDKIVHFSGRGQEARRVANTGIMVFSRRVLDFIPEGFCNIEKDVIFKLIGKEEIYAYMSDAFIKDFGTPERLESVRKRYSR